MKNKLVLLSLLSLLGILGIVSSERGFLGFFSFLYYLKYTTVIPDELFKSNVQKAATPAFFIGLACSAITIALKVLIKNDSIIKLGLGLGMALSIFIFTVILSNSEVNERVNTYDN